MNAMGGYTHMEAMGGGIFAKTAKATPLQSALRGFIAPNHADHPCVPHRGIPHATASGKGGMPNRNVINAHAFIATRYDKCATRHATSLLRPMRPAPPSITLRALGSKMPISPHGYRPPSYSPYEVCPRGYLRGVKWGISTTNQHAQLY